MTSNAVYQAQNLTLGYGSQIVLEQVNLQINPGEFWFFLGPNGQGKSTLLNCFLGNVKSLSGQIKKNAQLVNSEFMGFIPQRWEMGQHIPTTIAEVTKLGMAGIGLSKREQNDRLQWALEQVGLSNYEKSSFWDLSGGQRQRALVARALIRKPKVLLADEPTNGLDLKSETDLLGLLQNLNLQEKMTIVFVTHNVPLAMRYASHLAFFQKGQVVSGTRQDMSASETLNSMYNVALPVEDKNE